MTTAWENRPGTRGALGANLAVAAWLGADAILAVRAMTMSSWAAPLALFGVGFAIQAYWVLRRQPAVSDFHPLTVVTVLAAALFPITLSFFDMADISGPRFGVALAVQTVGGLLYLWSAIALGPVFSILPAARGLVARGHYAAVRHPMYAAFVVFDFSYVLLIGTPAVLVVWLFEILLLLLRSRAEEAFLLRHVAEYASYAKRTRYRFAPGLF